MTISEYVANLNERYKTGISREHSYRGDLQTLLQSILDNVLVTNEPARIVVSHKTGQVPTKKIENFAIRIEMCNY